MQTTFTLRHTIPVTDSLLSLAVSPDGRWLAATATDQKLHIWDTVTLAEIKTIHVGKRARALCFSPDASLVVAGSGSLGAWSTASWKRVQSFKGHRRSVAVAAFSTNGAAIYGGGSSDVSPFDNTLRMWDTATGEERQRWQAYGSVRALAVSPDGRSIALATESGQTMLLDATTCEPLWIDPPEARTSSLAFTPDGQLLGTPYHALLCDHDLATGAQRELMPAPPYAAMVKVSADGLFAFLACGNGGDPAARMVAAVELATKTIPWSASLGAMPRGLQLSPDGRRLYVYQYFPDQLVVFER